jgi:transcriptional regulator
MYSPAHFDESRPEVLQALIHAHPLATLVTLSPDGLTANHIPLHFQADGSPLGCLVGHVARANPVWQNTDGSVDVLVVFQGPNAYITPSWYATKQDTGKVVPTWNYAVVHARGKLLIRDDPHWVRQQLESMTTQHEATRAQPWAVADAPREFTDRLLQAIVGIEIPITQWQGKWKVSQNQPEPNRAGVMAGLGESGDSISHAMAALVAQHSPDRS